MTRLWRTIHHKSTSNLPINESQFTQNETINHKPPIFTHLITVIKCRKSLITNKNNGFK